MKKGLAILLVLMLTFALGITAFADDAATAEIYVTIADADGNLALAQEKLTVTDTDTDGVLTLHDALYAAHEAKFDGGAAAGYATFTSDYGRSLSKLWGAENGGSYGYGINNTSAWSLMDPIRPGDYVYAFVYTDLVGWSDTYCFFDVNTLGGKAGDTVTLTLSAAGFDGEYNPITLPVKGAEITLNGEGTGRLTDADGKAVITLSQSGVISARSETATLVPPVCIATVAGAAMEDQPESTPSTETKADSTNPKTGDAPIAPVILMLGASGGALLWAKNRKSDEE